MALPGEIDRTTCGDEDCGRPLELQVCQSAAGYFIGTECPMHGPNSRESGYIASREEAEDTLREWASGNQVGKRDTDFHPGGLEVIEITEDMRPTALMDLLNHAVPLEQDTNPLTAGKVETLLLECLYLDGAEITDGIVAQGIMNAYLFDPAKIDEHADTIHAMLLELPHDFHETVTEGEAGGGTSFLNMCMRKDGVQWTGLHQTQEHLMVLGMAAGWARIPLPRMMWGMLYGGMPYVTVCAERATVEHVGEEELAKIRAQIAEQEATSGEAH